MRMKLRQQAHAVALHQPGVLNALLVVGEALRLVPTYYRRRNALRLARARQGAKTGLN
jgi:hypothetical protein